MRYSKFLLLIGCNALAFASLAQTSKRDSIIPNQTIQITQIYKPEIAKPVKPEITPTLPNIDTAKPSFAYSVPQQTLNYTYHSVPIKPLALGKQEYNYPFQNYIQAGFGNLSSIYFDAGIGGFSGNEFETLFHLSHLSQSKESTRQRYSLTTFDGSGKYFLNDYIIGAKLNFFHKGINYYGYDQTEYIYGKNTIRQGFLGTNVSLFGENTSNKYNLFFKPEINFGTFSDQFDAFENNFRFNLPVSYQLDSSFSFSLGLEGSVSSLRVIQRTPNNYFRINPAVDIHLPNIQVHVGISPTIGKGNQWYALPDFSFRTELFRNSFAVVAGWKADLIQNTYQQLSNRNPFMLNQYPTKQTKSDIVYGGFETKLGQHLAFGATANWKQWKNLALFINDYSVNPDGKQFQTVYDAKVQSFGFDAYFRYQIAETVGLHLSSSINSFYHTTTYQKVWHEPQVKFQAKLNTELVKNLRLSGSLDFWDRMFALEKDGTSEKLPAFLDLGIQGEYTIIPRFSVFLQLNNLLNNKYQRWQQYDNFGFNIIGGLKFNF